jgi:hypothetical protein
MAKAIKDHFDKARAIINSNGKALAVSKVGTDIKLTGCIHFYEIRGESQITVCHIFTFQESDQQTYRPHRLPRIDDKSRPSDG